VWIGSNPVNGLDPLGLVEGHAERFVETTQAAERERLRKAQDAATEAAKKAKYGPLAAFGWGISIATVLHPIVDPYIPDSVYLPESITSVLTSPAATQTDIDTNYAHAMMGRIESILQKRRKRGGSDPKVDREIVMDYLRDEHGAGTPNFGKPGTKVHPESITEEAIFGRKDCPVPNAGAVPSGGTYVLRDATGKVVRSGRTNNLDRRMAEHARDPALKGYKFEAVHRTDVYTEQRGLEQLLHEAHRPPLNKINGIDPNNPRLSIYRNAAQSFLQRR
jgi:hypothetical protein